MAVEVGALKFSSFPSFAHRIISRRSFFKKKTPHFFFLSFLFSFFKAVEERKKKENHSFNHVEIKIIEYP